MRYLISFLFLFGVLSLQAQEFVVSGRCVDLRNVPVDGVKVSSIDAEPSIVYTDENGLFRLSFSKAGNYQINLNLVGTEHQSQLDVTLDRIGVTQLEDVKFNFQQEGGIIIQAESKDPFVIEKLPIIDLGKVPLGSVERSLIYTTAAVSNNELTSNYNVRGGSYDENLVYVNGFNVFRPFLTRSGQQEGMSFIHSALVKSIHFSAGGFESEYGDKLSSVLDIKYKDPDSLHASASLSLLGVEGHVEFAPSARFSYLAGARFRSNGYLLNSLPTKGAYNPVFWDAQVLTNFHITEKLTWSVLGHFSSNNYRFSPQTQKTDFGTANEAYSFTIYFEGNEQTRFQTMMGGTALKYQATKWTNLNLYATAFHSDEREYFDILGEYYINELETDPSKEEFGDSIAVLGIGSFLNHARNKLKATIFNVYHDGSHLLKNGFKDDERLNYRKHELKWGANIQLDQFDDVLSEWRMIDSAGYSVPQEPEGEIILFETVKGQLDLQTQRYTAYLQINSQWSRNKKNIPVEITKRVKDENKKKHEVSYRDTILESADRWALSLGVRSGYTTVNQEYYLTPRFSLKYYPRAFMVNKDAIRRRDLVFRLSGGLYYQPPIYREMRTFDGQLNLQVKSQKSAHAILGSDVFFNMWDRDHPFKLTTEVYYKYLWDLNPYEIENVRTRYYAENNAVGYAYGLDLNIHGEFVPGIESFFKMGLMSTKEDILDDYYYEYYNGAGEKIIFGYSEDQVVVDSARIEPSFVPRPTDQWLTFAALIQDRMPVYEKFSVQMGLQFGSRLPYGPPDFERYKDTLRMKSYFRVDIGFSYDFLYGPQKKSNFWNRNFTESILSFEVFNLLGVNNVLSKQWIQDVEGKYYSIPNYLTQRRFNLKLILRF